jgi:hypothetical protein
MTDTLRGIRALRDSDYWGAAARVAVAADEFLSAMGLEGTKEKVAQREIYGCRGPEIVTQAWSTESAPLTRRRVRGKGNSPVHPHQRLLLMEYQRLLLILLRSFSEPSDELAHLTSLALTDQAVSRFAMLTANYDMWSDERFWDAWSHPASYLHRELLGALQNLLVQEYEGEHATAGIVFVKSSDTDRLRWLPYVHNGLDLRIQPRFIRKLSDGKRTIFVFCGCGEFLGLFSVESLYNMLEPTCSWRITRRGLLEFRVGSSLRLLYSDGRWSYVDIETKQSLVHDREPSLNGPNRIIWEVAKRLHETGQGGLLLIVEDPEQLIKKDLCMASALNLPGPTRIENEERRLGNEDIATLTKHMVSNLNLRPKDLFLEQFRDRRVGDIGVDILTALAAVDGAVIVDRTGKLITFGAILRVPGRRAAEEDEGARTTAARFASKFGLAIAVSADGPVSAYYRGKEL